MESVIEEIVPISAILTLFLFLPWLIFHYMTRIREARSLDEESQALFESTVEKTELMEERIEVLERILDAEVPGWRSHK